MWILLAPVFLWAATAVVIPLVLHLLSKRKTVRIRFSTIRFLKLAEKESSSRAMIENILLWLLRTLLLIFLVLAFCRPVIRTKSSIADFFKRAPRDIAIVLDKSYSMGYDLGGKTVWDEAIATAIGVVQGLDKNDRVSLFMASDGVEPIISEPTPDKELALSLLKGLATGTGSSQIYPALAAANDVLMMEADQRDREIHIITDGQALPWAGFGQSGTNEASLPEQLTGQDKASETPKQVRKLEAKTEVFVTIVGASDPVNATPIDVEIKPDLIMTNISAQIQVKLGCTGQVRESPVALRIDDREVAKRSVVFGEKNEVSFSVPPMEAGMHTAKIEMPPDNLAIDNEFHFLFKVKDTVRSLCVGSQADTFFLMRALNPDKDGTTAFTVERVDAGGFTAAKLDSYSCVLLCNAMPLAGQAMVALEEYVAMGGLMVVFPGDGAGPQAYESFRCLPGRPVTLESPPFDSRRQILNWRKPQDPILQALQLEKGTAPVVGIVKRMAWGALDPAAEILITAGAEDPFLTARNFGNGRAMFFSVSADRSWANFPLSPFFLPITQRVMIYGNRMLSIKPYFWTSKNLSLTEHISQATESSSITGPDKKPVPVRNTMVENRKVLYIEDVAKPGVYSISSALSGKSEPAFAVNMARIESDLKPIDADKIPQIIGGGSVSVAKGKDDLARLLEERRTGRSLAERILWLVLILSVIEVLYANRRTKTSRPLSASLSVEPSGKVDSAVNK